MYYIIEFKYHSVVMNEEVMTIDIYRTKEDRDNDIKKILDNPRYKDVEAHDMKPNHLNIFVSDKEPFNISFH